MPEPKEKGPEKNLRPIELTEGEGYYENRAGSLIEELKRRGLYSEDLLYRGMSEEKLTEIQGRGVDRKAGGLGQVKVRGVEDQGEVIFAGDEKLLRNSADTNCPFSYGELIVVYRRDCFDVVNYKGEIDSRDNPDISCCTYKFKSPDNKSAAIVAIFLV